MRWPAPLLAVVALSAVLAGCSDGDDDGACPPLTEPGDHAISLEMFLVDGATKLAWVQATDLTLIADPSIEPGAELDDFQMYTPVGAALTDENQVAESLYTDEEAATTAHELVTAEGGELLIGYAPSKSDLDGRTEEDYGQTFMMLHVLGNGTVSPVERCDGYQRRLTQPLTTVTSPGYDTPADLVEAALIEQDSGAYMELMDALGYVRTVSLPEPQPASLDGLEVSDDFVVATARNDDQVLIVDGLAEQPGGERSLKAWIAPRDDPTSAEAIDLSRYDARAHISVTWWNGEFYIAGLKCWRQQSGRDLEDPTNSELCGTTVWDLYAYDPSSNSTRPVLSDVDLGERGALSVYGVSTPDQLLIWRGDVNGYALMSPDGRFEPLADPPATKQVGYCAIGASLYATSTPITNSSDMRPLNDFMTSFRLVDGAWEDVVLPETPTMTTRVSAEGCTADGSVVSTLEAPVGPGQSQADNGAEILRVSVEGALTWTPVPIDSLPASASGVRYIDMIDGYVTAEIEMEPGGPDIDERPATSLFVWNDSSWDTLSETVAAWPIGTGHDGRVEPLIVRDGTALLALDIPDTPGPPPTFHLYD